MRSEKAIRATLFAAFTTYFLCIAMTITGLIDPTFISDLLLSVFSIIAMCTGMAAGVMFTLDGRVKSSLTKEQRKKLREEEQKLEYDRRMADIRRERDDFTDAELKRQNKRTLELEAALNEEEESTEEKGVESPDTTPTSADPARCTTPSSASDDEVWSSWSAHEALIQETVNKVLRHEKKEK